MRKWYAVRAESPFALQNCLNRYAIKRMPQSAHRSIASWEEAFAFPGFSRYLYGISTRNCVA